jgi:hypothetical protein
VPDENREKTDEIEKYLVNHMKNTIVSSKPSGHE